MAISTCCGCCSLQKGSIIIGFIYLISEAAALIYLGITLSRLFSLPDDFNIHLFSVRAVMIGFLFYTIILLILTGVLIVGAINRVASYVFFFVSMSFGNIVVTFSYFIYETALMFMFSKLLPVTVVIYFISAAIGMSIHFNLWLVVYNFYQELVTDKFRKMFQHNTINYPHPVAPEIVYSS